MGQGPEFPGERRKKPRKLNLRLNVTGRRVKLSLDKKFGKTPDAPKWKDQSI